MSMELRGTTICAVRKNGHTSIAGDGQVTMGQSVIFKSHPLLSKDKVLPREEQL